MLLYLVNRFVLKLYAVLLVCCLFSAYGIKIVHVFEFHLHESTCETLDTHVHTSNNHLDSLDESFFSSLYKLYYNSQLTSVEILQGIENHYRSFACLTLKNTYQVRGPPIKSVLNWC